MSRAPHWWLAGPGFVLFLAAVAVILRSYFTTGSMSLTSVLFMAFLLITSVSLFAGAARAEKVLELAERMVQTWRRRTMEMRAAQPPEDRDDAD